MPIINLAKRMFPGKLELYNPVRLTQRQRLCLFTILLVGVAVRFLWLDRIPPGLWYDEALYSLDGYSVRQGHFAIFFDQFGHPREPLFPWLLGLAFYLMEPTVLVARCVSAACGSIAVLLMFPVSRRFLPPSWALAATAAFAVFRWHIHFSRTIFRAGLASPVALLTILLFLRWRERRRPVDAALCGISIGVCLYTYISLRIIPLLIGLWIIWLAARGALSLRREYKQILIIYGAALVTFLPLGLDYVRHPEHVFGRTDEVSMFEKTVPRTLPDGSTRDVSVKKSAPEAIGGISENALAVAKTWFVKGDHVARHNIPYRPVFDPVTGGLFLLGIIGCTWALVRSGSPAPMMLLSWFGGFAMASVLSFGAPNILRMQGASPAVCILMVMGLRQLMLLWPRIAAPIARKAVPFAIIAFFGLTQLNDYFRVFPALVEVQNDFTTDIFYKPAKAVDDIAPTVDKVYVPAELLDSLQVRFATIRRKNIVPYKPDDKLAPPTGKMTAAYLVTRRSSQLAEEAGNDQFQRPGQFTSSLMSGAFSVPQEIYGPEGREVRYQSWAELWVVRPGS